MQIASIFSEIRDWLNWAPDWVNALILIAIAVLAALTIHGAVHAAVRRTIPEKQVFLRLLIERMRGPIRLALVIFLVGAILPVLRFAPEIAVVTGHVLLIALVALLGWVALTLIQLAAGFYLRRLQLDAPDNLSARKLTTQIRILERTVVTLVVIFTVAGVLMTFEPVRQYGVSIFASAGVAGIIAGLAARPVLSNLFAGLQIAIAQPIRIEDVVIVEGEWGRIEEITATYVVVRIWDLRRLVVPLTYFIERPFQNWTRDSTALLAPVILHLDYSAPIDAIRRKTKELAEASPLWDGATNSVQVTDSSADGIKVRVLLSARNSGDQWNLICDTREKLIEFLQREHPYAFVRQRTKVEGAKSEREKEAAASGSAPAAD